MRYLFSHAEEIHTSTIESAAHSLQWYAQLPLFILMVAVFAAVVWLITKKQDITLLLTAALLLVSGVGFYEIAPLISVLAITVGLGATLFATIVGLSESPKKSNKK